MSTVNKITVTKNSSSNTYGLKDIDALRSAALTNVENEFVATKAYAINDYLYRDDIFYKVIAPIPRGGTFVINQNIKATMLTNELAMLNPTVIANPTGEATGELETLQVGNIIYGVGGGGGTNLVSVIGSDDTETAVPTSKVTPIELTSSSFSGEDSSFIYFRLGRNATLNQRPTGVTYQDFGLYFSVNDSDAVLAYYNDSPITESDIYNLDKKKIYIGYLRAIAGDPVTYRFEIHEVDDMSAGIDNVIVGTAAHAEGKNTTAYGNNTHSEGSSTCAYGSNSHAEGQGTTAYGSQSHAEGASTYAIYVDSHAEGTGSTAYGQGSHAEGGSTYAKGLFSHSEGDITTAQGNYAHAEGISTYAIADYSHAEGYSTSSQGNYSHSEGMNTSAVGHQTHTEGNQCTALGDQSHAEGYKTYAYDDYAHAEGSQTCANLASHSENYYTRAIGNYAHAEGNYTTAGGSSSHAEGCYTYAADYAHAEGSGKAYGSYSHAEGNYTNTASGATGAHAEGAATYAKGSYSHAEGAYTTTIGEASHTQGQNTTATGNRSSAAGNHTAAGYNDQFVIGYYNNNKSTSIFEVGNGTYETTSNALELDASGNLVVSGSITDGDGNVLGPSGTTVIANPAEASTDTLTKLQVGSTIYGISGSGTSTLAALTDTNITTPTDTQTLKYDSASSKWVNVDALGKAYNFKIDTANNDTLIPVVTQRTLSKPFAKNDIIFLYMDTDGVFVPEEYVYRWKLQYTFNNTAITGDIYDGLGNSSISLFNTNLPRGTWLVLLCETYNSEYHMQNYVCIGKIDPASGGGGASTLADLTDTNIVTPSDGQLLTYDATSGKQINANAGGGTGVLTYEIVTKSTGGSNAAVTVNKYVNKSRKSSTDYLYSQAQTPVTIDDKIVLDYGSTASGKWTYTLLEASEDHAVGYSDSWAYSATVDKMEEYESQENPDTLDAIDDVSLTLPFGSGQPITFDATSGKWANGGVIPIANGGTGNNTGYVQAGRKANTSIGSNATAEGIRTTASGNQSHAEGVDTVASNTSAHAEGGNTQATGLSSHAEGGGGVVASGASSHAEGAATQASGNYSHAEGQSTKAQATGAHSQNFNTTASGNY